MSARPFAASPLLLTMVARASLQAHKLNIKSKVIWSNYSAGGSSILKSSLPSTLPLTSVSDVEFVVVAQLSAPPAFLSPSPNASLLLTAIGPSVLLINTIHSKVITRLEGHVGSVTDAVFCGQSCACTSRALCNRFLQQKTATRDAHLPPHPNCDTIHMLCDVRRRPFFQSVEFEGQHSAVPPPSIPPNPSKVDRNAGHHVHRTAPRICEATGLFNQMVSVN